MLLPGSLPNWVICIICWSELVKPMRMKTFTVNQKESDGLLDTNVIPAGKASPRENEDKLLHTTSTCNLSL